jgi:hypothetical protein
VTLASLQVVYKETNDGDGRDATPSTTVAQLKESENNVDDVEGCGRVAAASTTVAQPREEEADVERQINQIH